MASVGLFLIFSLCFSFVQSQSSVACPFNAKECKCTNTDPPSATSFLNVDCETSNGLLPNFEGSRGQYSVTGEMSVKYNVNDIPGKHFSVFKTITSLSLEQSITFKPTHQKWDTYAFDGVDINSLSVTGLAGMFPLPEAVKILGNQGLNTLYIAQAFGPIQLETSTFKDFTNLRTLSIDNTPIQSISSDAFLHLIPSLRELTLTKAQLNAYPSDALIGMNQLTRLILDSNFISTIPDKALLELKALTLLSLGDNPIAASIDQGSLDNLSPTTTRLFLDSISLVNVPKRVITKNQQLAIFSLTDNRIDTIQADDFADAINVTGLYLDSNPITTVKEGAFSKMKDGEFINLQNTKLAAVDLSVFVGAPDTIEVYFDNSYFLKHLTASDKNKVPAQASFHLTSTALTTIHPTIRDLLDAKKSITIDISNNVNLVCDGLAWLAYFAQCQKNVKIDGARCADKSNQPLSEYLQMVEPSPCADTTVGPPTTPGTSGPTSGTGSTASAGTGSTSSGQPTTETMGPSTSSGSSTASTSGPTTTVTTTVTTPVPPPATTAPHKGASQVYSHISLILMGVFAVFSKYLF